MNERDTQVDEVVQAHDLPAWEAPELRKMNISSGTQNSGNPFDLDGGGYTSS